MACLKAAALLLEVAMVTVMRTIILLNHMFVFQVAREMCSAANVERVSTDELDTLTTDQLSLSETHNDQEPLQVSEEPPEYLVEWEDYEDSDPVNNCNLTSFEGSSSATYQCQDGTVWTVSVEEAGDDLCIYSRSITNLIGQTHTKRTAVKCAIAKEWMQDLVQYEVLSGVPDMFLFDSDKIIDKENVEVSPTFPVTSQ